MIFDQRRSLHRSNLVEHLTVTNPLLQERLSQLQALVLERGEGPGRVADQALQLLSDQVGRQASLLAFSDVFRVVGLLFLLALFQPQQFQWLWKTVYLLLLSVLIYQ